MTALLETRGVGKAFGLFRALEDVSIALHAGELVSVVGPNGAGKTTLVNVLTGLTKPTSGDVLFMGRSVAGLGPVRLADCGLARAFQLIHIFPRLTVMETIATAVVSRQRKRWRLFSQLASDGELDERVRKVARIFDLDRRLDMLDEPTSGVSTADKHGIMRTLIEAAKVAGVKGILLVEHDMDLVAAYSHRIIALSEGRVLADLPADRFFDQQDLIDVVIGKRRGA